MSGNGVRVRKKRHPLQLVVSKGGKHGGRKSTNFRKDTENVHIILGMVNVCEGKNE
jgi:cysteine sulfinate desulfinase/cysteine desulfurase-like protein